jgi:hypothetical protein
VVRAELSSRDTLRRRDGPRRIRSLRSLAQRKIVDQADEDFFMLIGANPDGPTNFGMFSPVNQPVCARRWFCLYGRAGRRKTVATLQLIPNRYRPINNRNALLFGKINQVMPESN